MNDGQLLRYSRQILLPEFDVAGQQRLLDAHALIVGLGGLGSPAALYLAAAGVGRLTLADGDKVELSNLQRQIAHGEATLGECKAASAAACIERINSTLRVATIEARLEGERLRAAAAAADVVVDATDNLAARHAINAACLAAGVPLVSGAAIGLEGQIAVFDPRRDDSPCYRCLYAEDGGEALNCAESGVAAPVVGIVGAVQAMEAMKVIAGAGEPLVGQVLCLDAKRMAWRRFRLPRDPKCPACSSGAWPPARRQP